MGSVCAQNMGWIVRIVTAVTRLITGAADYKNLRSFEVLWKP
jgi:hypothetical protein